MDFTIITPSYNYGRFLDDCLMSVKIQTGVDIEHLVYDAGSTDESAEIASRYPHVTWIQEPDKGMSDAINKGFDRATGDWVIWLNADDRLKPDILRKLLSLLHQTRADVVYGNYDFINKNGGWMRFMNVPRWSKFVHLHHHCYVPSTAAFYRFASVIGKGHRLHPEFNYVMDGEFYARLNAAGFEFSKVNLNIADFRMHGENASQRHLNPTREINEVLYAEKQHCESRAIRRVYGITLFGDPYLNGIVDGLLWIAARLYKGWLRIS